MVDRKDDDPKQPRPELPPHLPAEVRVWRSEDLLQGEKEIFILHHDVYYRLRVTRQGRLILYK